MATTDLHQFTLMWLFVFCHLFVSIECGVKVKRDLTVLKGNLNVTDQAFINGTNECLTSFDPGNLSLELKGVRVDRPGDMKVSVFDYQVSGFLVSGIRVKWSSPRADMDRYHLKGFFILTSGEKIHDRCRLYLINNTAFQNDELEFTFAMNKFSYERDNFMISIYSLPPPLTMDQIGTYRSVLVTTKDAWKITFPGTWSPSISLSTSFDQNIGSVDVYFTLPPKIEGWLLKEFEVMLVKCSKSLVNSFRSKTITKEVNTTDTQGHWQFTGLKWDLYSVVVRVRNHNMSQCVCKRGPDQCNPSCGATQTTWFDLLGNKHERPSQLLVGQETCLTLPTTTEIVTEPPNFHPTPGSTSQEQSSSTERNLADDGLSAKIVIGISVVVLLAMFSLVVAFLCWRQRRDKYTLSSILSRHCTKPGSSSPYTRDATDILRKVVYIMSTADHKASVRVLDCFSDLLEKYCQCDVISHRHADLTHTCESAWVTSTISKSDCVVFLNFKGMEMLVDTFLQGQTTAPEPNHTIFLKTLQMVFNATHRNFISVNFTQDWTEDRLTLLNPKKFVLPKELNAFVAGVHNVSERSVEEYMKKSLPNVDHLENLPEYRELKGAIRDLSEFEKNNKDFFDASYNIISTSTKSPASISSSISSGCSSAIHGSLSISETDITCDVEDSPVSVFGQPSFSQAPSSPDDGIDLDEGNIFSISSLPGLRNVLLDGQSAITMDQVSDTQCKDTQKCSQFDIPRSQLIPPRTLSNIKCDNISMALKQTNEDSQSKKTSASKNPQPLQVIIPPRNKIGLSNDDSLSTRLADLNDTSSTWSKPSDVSASYRIESENDRRQQPLNIKPPLMSMPMDNISNMLVSFNDQDSEACFGQVDSSALEKEEFYDSGLPEMSV